MKYAGFWRQFLSVVIDQLVIWIPGTIIPQLYFYLAVASGGDPIFVNYYMTIIALALPAAMFAVYYVVLNGRYGVTAGRHLLNLKLISVDQPNRDGIGYGRAALRVLLFAVFGGFFRVSMLGQLPLWLGVGIDTAATATLCWLLIDRRRRTLEDVVAGTAVVYDPKGKFELIDPDKLPEGRIRPVGFAFFLAVYALLAWYAATRI